MDETTLNDLLECSVCLERLDTTSKVLPCQHTFCRKCLEVIVSSHTELRCPECRVLVEIKIEDLPPNVLLMRILEGMKNATHNQLNNSISARNSVATTAANNLIHKTQTGSSNTQMVNGPKLIKLQAAPHNGVLNEQHAAQNIVRSHVTTKQFTSNTTAACIPHAKALYDFNSKEPTDISFKKGDRVLLRKRLDMNWFIGECNGREGTFPVNYVQIIVPLPVPQCKAMYDFRMGPNEEEGCLTFKKGAIINVFRRVDLNWAEGRIGDLIGIFPIAFVQMNDLAKQLMESTISVQYANMPSRNVPPTPIELNSSSSDSSSTVTSPNTSTSSNTTSSSSTAPSSPTNHLPNDVQAAAAAATGVVTAQQKTGRLRDHSEKRHSLTALTTINAAIASANSNLQQSNRHSAEILSAPQTSSDLTILPSSSSQTCAASSTAATSDQMKHKFSTRHNSADNTLHAKLNAIKVAGHNFIPTLPATYVALYPYKPQKSDELELKKGSFYLVTERCQDGWFKGVNNRAQKSGVFPGNYVAPLRTNSRDQQPAAPQTSMNNHSKRSTHNKNAQTNSATGQSQQHQQPNSLYGNVPGSVPPPELPPRSLAGSGASVWVKPLGQHVESFFSRKSFSGPSNKRDSASNTGRCSDSGGQSSGGGGNNTTHATNTSNNTTNNVGPNKDKKESSSAVSLMKRLTNMKRSKSPIAANPSSPYSMDNPVFEDPTAPSIGTISNPPPVPSSSSKRSVQLSHPVHVRSGSCPSQLLQSLPIDLNTSIPPTTMTTTATSTETSGNNSYMFGSQRVKGHKERPILHGMRTNATRAINSIDASGAIATNFAGMSHSSNKIGPTMSSYHRKSQSLDAATISMQIGQTASKTNNKTHSLKERFRCIVSYPPNSEFELELHVGDIVYVHKKRDNGWYKGTHSRTGKMGLFPASFVEPDI